MSSRIAILICLLSAVIFGGCGSDAPNSGPRDKASSVDPPAGATASNPSAAAPSIDPRADAALRRMSAALSAAKTFKVHSVASIEMRTAGGQLAQFSRDSTLTFSRPNLLAAEVRRGAEIRRLWHSGKELTILDAKDNQYAVIPTSESLEDALDELADEYGIVIPLDDLLYADPYKELIGDINSGSFVDQQDIDGATCDHLLFKQDNVDWQIWIDTGQKALPRKVVITYKDEPDRPQFEAVLDQWQLAVPVDAAVFTPKLPENARRVEADDLLAADEDEGD